LATLAGIGSVAVRAADESGYLVGSDLQVNILADEAREHFATAESKVAEIDDLETLHLLAAEGQQLTGNGGGFAAGFQDILRVLLQLPIERGIVLDELRVAINHRKRERLRPSSKNF
jgi:hypothetical protein